MYMKAKLREPASYVAILLPCESHYVVGSRKAPPRPSVPMRKGFATFTHGDEGQDELPRAHPTEIQLHPAGIQKWMVLILGIRPERTDEVGYS